jgi:hypothetical protein
MSTSYTSKHNKNYRISHLQTHKSPITIKMEGDSGACEDCRRAVASAAGAVAACEGTRPDEGAFVIYYVMVVVMMLWHRISDNII